MYSVSPASSEALEELVATLRYVCMYVFVCVCMYVCMCWSFPLVCMCVCVAGTSIYPHVCTCVFMYVCVLEALGPILGSAVPCLLLLACPRLLAGLTLSRVAAPVASKEQRCCCVAVLVCSCAR